MLKEKPQTKEREKSRKVMGKWEKGETKITWENFSLQPQTEGVAESTLGEELKNYDATRHDKRFQCMSAWSTDQTPVGESKPLSSMFRIKWKKQHGIY